MAGGTDLIDHIRTERFAPDVVVDVKKIPELGSLTLDESGLKFGAAVSCRSLASHPQIRQQFEALADACGIIGGIQIQSRASVGGNLCTSGAAGDTIPALIALGAECEILGPGGSRWVNVEDFCTGPGTNVLEPGELLVTIHIGQPHARQGSHYRRFIPRNEMDIAVVGVGAKIGLDPDGAIDAARVGLGAVAPKPLVADALHSFLVGKSPTDQVFQEAGEIAKGLISPIDDHRGTKEFRTHVTGVLVARVLAEASRRAAASE